MIRIRVENGKQVKCTHECSKRIFRCFLSSFTGEFPEWTKRRTKPSSLIDFIIIVAVVLLLCMSSYQNTRNLLVSTSSSWNDWIFSPDSTVADVHSSSPSQSQKLLSFPRKHRKTLRKCQWSRKDTILCYRFLWRPLTHTETAAQWEPKLFRKKLMVFLDLVVLLSSSVIFCAALLHTHSCAGVLETWTINIIHCSAFHPENRAMNLTAFFRLSASKTR